MLDIYIVFLFIFLEILCGIRLIYYVYENIERIKIKSIKIFVSNNYFYIEMNKMLISF